jgi:hypothetical protein
MAAGALRRLHGRVRFTNQDRWFFIRLDRGFRSVLQIRHPDASRPRYLVVSIKYLDCGLTLLDKPDNACIRVALIDDLPQDRFCMCRIAGDQKAA